MTSGSAIENVAAVLIVLMILFSACGQQDDELPDLDHPPGPPTIVIRANLDAQR